MNYVLFDSWFSSPKVIRSMKALGLDVVAMVKKSSKIHYRFQGQMCSCKDICFWQWASGRTGICAQPGRCSAWQRMKWRISPLLPPLKNASFSPKTAGGIYYPERGNLRAGHGFPWGVAC
ncbi:MAG: hypothetical protein MR636_04435 [Clostridiales bacterium]|nr:hypothetical protein [Clostridiales bacterium]